jgi:DNA-binding NtrC family response regulator
MVIEHPPGETLYGRHMREFRVRMLAHYLAAHQGNVSATARTLGLNRTYLDALMRKFHLRAP